MTSLPLTGERTVPGLQTDPAAFEQVGSDAEQRRRPGWTRWSDLGVAALGQVLIGPAGTPPAT